MKFASCVGAFLVSQAFAGEALAGDFADRFYSSFIATSQYQTYVSTIALTSTHSLKPAALRPQAGWRLDDATVVGFDAAIEPLSIATTCGVVCVGAPQRFRATLGVASGASFFYVTAGAGIPSEPSDGFPFVGGFVLPEKWTTGVGAAYTLNSGAKIWAQLDATTYSFDGLPPGLRASLPGTPLNDFALKGGLILPFYPSTSDALDGRIGPANAALRDWWDFIMKYIVPTGPTPR